MFNLIYKPHFWLSLALNLYTALNEIAICGGSGVSSKFKNVFLGTPLAGLGIGILFISQAQSKKKIKIKCKLETKIETYFVTDDPTMYDRLIQER